MRGKDLFEKLTDIDDDIITETSNAVKHKKTIYLKWIAAAACFAVTISMVAFLDGKLNTSQGVISDSISDSSLNSSLDSKLDRSLDSNLDSEEKIEDTKGPFSTIECNGFSVLLAYDVSELKNANPWDKDIAIKNFPIIKNKNYMIEIEQPDYTLMKSLLKQTAQDLGMSTKNLSTTDDMFIEDENYKVEVDKNCIIDVDFKVPVKLPSEYNFTYNATYEELQKVAEFLKEEYASFIGMKNPIINIDGGDYSYSGEQHYTISFFEKGKDIEQSILNYNFNNITFSCNENGEFSGFYKSYVDLSDVMGNVPIIDTDEALNLLEDGKFYANVLYDYYILKKEYVRKIELVYLLGYNGKLLMPYYQFYLEEPNGKLENGLKSYGIFYVPAVEEKSVEKYAYMD